LDKKRTQMCVDAEYLMEKVMEMDGERCEGFYVAIGWTISMIFMTRMGREEINLIVSNEIRLEPSRSALAFTFLSQD
jgi:hypothetical protein